MPAKKKTRSSDEPPGTPTWMVTFSDCMTLLLCFFVMLVTFSSFDESSLRRIAGVFRNRSLGWIFPTRRDPRDSVVEPVDRPTDSTDEGSEKPTDWARELIEFPKPPMEIIAPDTYRDRKVFTIPSERLFYGRGCALRPEGRRHLRMIAAFMKLVPCRVVISETGPETDDARRQLSLERAWTLMKYFLDQGLSDDRFNISAGGAAGGGRFAGKSIVRIGLLARSLFG